MQVKPFEQDPKERYLKLTNYLFDVVMPEVKPNTWKVLCLIIRKTTGFNKAEDRLSISQIMQGTGIKNRNTATAAIGELEQGGYVLVNRDDKHVDGNRYLLNLDYEAETGSTEIVLPTRTGSTEIVLDQAEITPADDGGSTEIVLQVVQKSYTQNNNFKNHSSQNLESKEDIALGTKNGLPPPAFPDPGELTVSKIRRLKLTKVGWLGLLASERDGKNRTTVIEFIENKIKSNHPAISKFRLVTGRYPQKVWWDDIIDKVGDNSVNVEAWEKVVKHYAGVGWNPNNVVAMLEFYERRELPSTNGVKRIIDGVNAPIVASY